MGAGIADSGTRTGDPPGTPRRRAGPAGHRRASGRPGRAPHDVRVNRYCGDQRLGGDSGRTQHSSHEG